MKFEYRPFAVLGFVTAAVLIACVYLNEYAAVFAVAAGLVSLVLTLCVRKFRHKMLPYFLSAALIISGSVFIVRDSGFGNTAEAFDGKSLEVSAVVTESAQRKNSRVYYMAKAEEADGDEVDFSVRLSLPYELDVQIGDRITMPVKLYKIGANSDSAALYYMAKGVRLGAYPDSEKEFDSSTVKIEYAAKQPAKQFFADIRNISERRIYEKLPNEYGALINGMLFGDTDLLSQETQNNIKEAGIAPLFAVSGLHLSIWVLGLYEILKQFNIRKRLNSAVCIVFTLLFMAVTGMRASVFRAGIMMIIMLSGNLLRRRQDSFNSLGLAAFLLCISEPYTVADLGFLLSFTATAGIVLCCPMFERCVLSKFSDRLILRPVKSIISTVAVSVFATLGAFPVTVIFLKYFSVWTVITNLAVSFLAPICMLFGGLSVMLYRVGFLSDFAALISGISVKAIEFIIQKIASADITTVSTADNFWQYGIIISLCFLVFTAIAFKGRRAVKAACCGILIIAVAFSAGSYVYYDGLMQAEIINLGSSYSVIIHDKSFKALIGCGLDSYSSVNISDRLDYAGRGDSEIFLLPKSQSDNTETYSLLKNNSFGTVVTKECSESLKTVTGSAKIVDSGNYEYRLNNGSAVYFYDTDELSLAMLEFTDKKVLFILNADYGVELPEEFSEADCLVCAQIIPDSIDKSGFSFVIACGTQVVAQSVVQDKAFVNTTVVEAFRFDSVTVNIKNGNIKIITRED